MKEKTARVRMLGCAFEYQCGQEYDLPAARAAELVGLGYAVYVTIAEIPAEEE
jgi:hypothetical protein